MNKDIEELRIQIERAYIELEKANKRIVEAVELARRLSEVTLDRDNYEF